MTAKGLIFNIQKFSIHDGPGIRTTVFFKGCPLSCWWCHNPESICFDKEPVFNDKLCIDCKRCDRNDKYDLSHVCDKKVDVCPTAALTIAGSEYTVDELMKEILKDKIFYKHSKGGITFSGGEPLMQHEFLIEVLKACKSEGLDTSLDTTGYVKWDTLKAVSEFVDLFLYDLKFFDDTQHQKYTGVSNKLILENLKHLSDMGKKIYIRIPVIPNINDTDESIKATCEFISNLDIKQVNLLPYHDIAKGKYNNLQKEYKLDALPVPSDKTMEALKAVFESYNIKTVIGG